MEWFLTGKPASFLVVRDSGYHVMEVNASDTRNKADRDIKKGAAGKLSNLIKELATTSSIGVGGQLRQDVLVMDEVDGMSGILTFCLWGCHWDTQQLFTLHSTILWMIGQVEQRIEVLSNCSFSWK